MMGLSQATPYLACAAVISGNPGHMGTVAIEVHVRHAFASSIVAVHKHLSQKLTVANIHPVSMIATITSGHPCEIPQLQR